MAAFRRGRLMNSALYMTKKPVLLAQAGNHFAFGTEVS